MVGREGKAVSFQSAWETGQIQSPDPSEILPSLPSIRCRSASSFLPSQESDGTFLHGEGEREREEDGAGGKEVAMSACHACKMITPSAQSPPLGGGQCLPRQQETSWQHKAVRQVFAKVPPPAVPPHV